MEIIYSDRRILAAIKPPGVLSTDEPGGMPELLRKTLGDDKACIRTVHRLDQVVSGLMLFARSREASRRLSMEIQEKQTLKEYLAVIHGVPEEETGILRDLLWRDPRQKKTFVVTEPGRKVREAVLDYELLGEKDGRSLIRVRLHTGRTHQIRVQFSSRGMPLVGDKKYGIPDQADTIALWSYRITFCHPETEAPMTLSALPPKEGAWTAFGDAVEGLLMDAHDISLTND